MSVISIFNQKGGVGKSTTAINLAAGLAKNYKVLLADMDAQGNATTGSGIEESGNMYALLQKKIKVISAIVSTDYGYDIIPSDITLSDAEITLSNILSRETILRKALEPVRELYDYIIIDCPPSLGLLAINSLVASDYLIVPVAPSFFPVKGIQSLVTTMELVKETLNSKLEIMGVLVTMYDKRKNLARQTREGLHEVFGDKLFNTVIRVDSQIEYSQDDLKPLLAFNDKCRAGQDYINLIQEVINYGR